MMILRFCLCFSCFVAGFFPLYSQPSQLPNKNIVFDQLPDKLGLEQSTINCVIQDRDGFLWIGTWSGLIRYDGYSTVIYRSDNAPDKIKSNKITSLCEGHDGALWIGTLVGGLFRYDKSFDKFTQFVHEPGNKTSLSNSSIWAVQEDKNGVLWVGTENGLNRYDAKENTFQSFHTDYTNSHSISHSFITDLFLSARGDLWIGTENGLNKLCQTKNNHYDFEQFIYNEGKAKVSIDPGNHYLHNYVFQIKELITKGSSSIWYSTIKGLKRLENGIITHYELSGKTSSFNYFRSLEVVQGDNPLLLVGSEMGLNFFDPVKMQFTKFLGNFDPSINLTHNTVTAIFVDRGGVLWVGTKKGINKYDSFSKDFRLYRTSSFDKTNSIITGICESVDHGYWVSTLGGGLYKFNGERFVHYRINNKAENDFTEFIQTLYKDSNGNIWVGTAGSSAFMFNERDVNTITHTIPKFIHYNNVKALSDSHIMAFTEDNQGTLWVGMWSVGLNSIEPSGKVTQYTDSILSQAPVVALYADHAGVLWAGTRGNGLYRITMRNEKLVIRQFLHQAGDKKSLVNNFINSIYEDHAGTLWIGTEGGLVALDRRTNVFELKATDEAQHSSVVVDILEDDAGKLWIANWDGITVFDPIGSSGIKHYDSHDRIQGGFFYNNVSVKDHAGNLLFGGSNGFNVIDPTLVKQNPVIPEIVISNFQIYNKLVPFGKEFNNRIILDKPLSEMGGIELKHDENSLAFEFAALDYAAPEKIRYAYKLEGFDMAWNYTDASRRYANYTNLKEGHYTLVVKASSTDGVWNNETSNVVIIIHPPWWKTWWAGVLYFVLAGVLLYFLRRMILMRVTFMHELKVGRMQRDNLEKLNKAKLEFFTNVSHEFRTPLTLILGPAQNLLDSFEGGKLVRDKLLSINNNAQRLLRLVNQLLDFRKTESGNLKLEIKEGNMVTFIKEIKLSFDPLAAQLKIDFTFIASSNVIVAWFDRDQYEKIMFNLLSNAFKNTTAGGKIQVQLTEERNHLLILVEDNGKGIKVEHFESVFQSFFSYDQEHHHVGTGIGLALTKSLVEMHHGQISVESKEHQFTRFVIRMPLGNAHFDASELRPLPNINRVDSYPKLERNVISADDERGSANHEHDVNLQDLPKLLIIEDNTEVRAYIKSVFLGNYIVYEAGEGKEGLDIALEEMPDLIISDVMMPIMDGITFCKEIKANVKTSHIPVILLTARTSLIFKVEGLETGADDYITKPFNPKVLELKVKNIMRTRALMRRTFNDADVLSIEPKRVSLTSTDETFVKNALASIEKNMANADYTIEDLSRDVAMSRMQLYRKLKALTGQSANEFIRTIRLKRAAQLLEQNQLTIAEVTYEVGFNDLQYFRECFKKLFRVTPSEYVQHKAGHVKKIIDSID